MTKSPGTNSPESSTKKQRSASPSYATPRSAPSSRVLRTMNSRFSGSSGFGSWFGNVPSGSKKQRHGVDRQPLEHRRQHRAGHPVRRVDHDAQRPDGADVDEREHLLDEARIDVFACAPVPGLSLRARPSEPAPGRARRGGPTRRRPAARRARTIFMPVYSFGLCEAVTAMPPSRPSVVDGEIEHLRPDHADVGHVRAGLRGAANRRRPPSPARGRACPAPRRSAPAGTPRRTRARSRARPPRRAPRRRRRARRRP